MKKIIGTILIGLIAACCTATKPSNVVVMAPIVVHPTIDSGVPVKYPQIITGVNWKLSVPPTYGSWVSVQEKDKKITAEYMNESVKTIFVMAENKTKSSFDDYASETATAIDYSGGKLISSREVEINGQMFYALTAFKTMSAVPSSQDIWVSVRNGIGYVFTCGGPTESYNQEICISIANSIRFTDVPVENDD